MKNRWICVLVVAVPGAISLGASQYQLSTLPMPSGTTYVQVGGINQGRATGTVFLGDYDSLEGYFRPIVWQNGAYSLLPIAEGESGMAGAINALGVVSGGVWSGAIPNPTLPGIAGTWIAGQFQPLSIPSGYSGSVSGINLAGEVVGGVESLTDRLPTQVSAGYAVRWTAGQPTKIGDFPNAWSNAVALNGVGQILLNVGDGSYTNTYVWTNGTLTQIQPISANTVAGHALNDAGQVVGEALSSEGNSHAFLWQNGTTLDLGMAVGETSSVAVGINESGTIVGYGYDANGRPEGLFWENGQLYNLLTLLPANSGWSSLKPSGIADDGSIAGTGIYDGQAAAFLLTPSASPSGTTPAPEPATAAALALAAPLLLRRRRRSA